MDPVQVPQISQRGALRWVIGIAALVAALGCEAVRPFGSRPEPPVDLSPLLEMQTEINPAIGLWAAFPDYDAIAIAGIQQANGAIRQDGVVDLVQKTYDAELDPRLTWSVNVVVTLFDTPAQADRDLDASCSSLARSSGMRVRWEKGQHCGSAIDHLRNDPLRLHLPGDLYSSWLFVRRDRIVVRMYERHVGSRASAKNAIIAELAERLARLKPARSAD